MDNLRKIGKYFTFILFIAAGWLVFNSAVNGHYHKLANGDIVYHSHPFKHSESSNSPFEEHRHNRTELLLIFQVSNIIFLLTVVLGIVIKLPVFHYKKFIFKGIHIPSQQYRSAISYRGPPLF